MEKIIIRNDTDMPMYKVIPYVQAVVRDGRTSDGGVSYCLSTVWPNGVTVYAERNSASDTFLVRDNWN